MIKYLVPFVVSSNAFAIVEADTFKLHSRPSANKTIFLDFDGHVVTKTPWNIISMGTSFTCPPYDFDGNPASFSSAELTRIRQIWQRVSADFSVFDVDVTTEAPPDDRLIRSSITDSVFGIRIIYSTWGPQFSTGAAGVSFGKSFVSVETSGSDTPVFIYAKTVQSSSATSHELGHALGLSHDGKGTVAYYGGHGTGEFSWGPIMGQSYTRTLATWDAGSYYGSNNTGTTANYGQGADDVAVISKMIPLVNDDEDGKTVSGTAFGVINSPSDIDTFSFSTSGGVITITADPNYYRYFVGGVEKVERFDDLYSSTPYVEGAPDLRVQIELMSSGKLLLQSSNQNLHGTLTTTIPAGSYTIRVRSVGFGDPMATTPSGFHAGVGGYRLEIK